MPSIFYRINFHLRKAKSKIVWVFTAYPKLLFDYYYLKSKGVETQFGYVTLKGLPIISKAKGSRIIIDKGCILVSKSKFNVAGINHPVILATLSSGAVIKIGRSGFSGSTICAAKEVIIGDDCAFGVNSCVYDTDFHPVDADRRINQQSIFDAACAPVSIEDKVWMAANSIVLKGVSIGEGAVIGAGSVVTADIPPYTIYAGNPARKIKDIGTTELNNQIG
ncbi:MAG: hypothetical protein J5I50_01670 [Chitinophagaceae bacterium]|nr:hypothetical protein [Chitinophagaceae bacterium]